MAGQALNYPRPNDFPPTWTYANPVKPSNQSQSQSQNLTQNPELRTQNSEPRTQNPELRIQNSELRTKLPFPLKKIHQQLLRPISFNSGADIGFGM